MQEKYELEQLMELVQTKQFRKLRSILMEMNEVDVAEFLDELGPEETILVFRLLPKEQAAEVFAELEDSDDQERLINALNDKELREVLDELYLDDTVDVIEDMPANVVSRILRNSDPASRSQINQLLNYPKDSAGSIMTTEYVFLHPDATVEESFARIRKEGMDKETIYTCYVTQNRVLLGVVTVRRLLLSAYETRIRDIMETNVLSVNTHDDKERPVRQHPRRQGRRGPDAQQVRPVRHPRGGRGQPSGGYRHLRRRHGRYRGGDHRGLREDGRHPPLGQALSEDRRL